MIYFISKQFTFHLYNKNAFLVLRRRSKCEIIRFKCKNNFSNVTFYLLDTFRSLSRPLKQVQGPKSCFQGPGGRNWSTNTRNYLLKCIMAASRALLSRQVAVNLRSTRHLSFVTTRKFLCNLTSKKGIFIASVASVKIQIFTNFSVKLKHHQASLFTFTFIWRIFFAETSAISSIFDKTFWMHFQRPWVGWIFYEVHFLEKRLLLLGLRS